MTTITAGYTKFLTVPSSSSPCEATSSLSSEMLAERG